MARKTRKHTRDTCLVWGPRDDTLPALIAFRDRVAHYLERAHKRAADIDIYRRMIPVLEKDLIAATVQISERKRREAKRRKQAA